MICWVDRRDLTRDLYASRLTSHGTLAPGWPADGIYLATGIGELWAPAGVPDGTGGAILAWEDESNLPTTVIDIYAQRVTGDGQVAPGWPPDGLPICTAPKQQRQPLLVADGMGGAFIAWRDQRNDTAPFGPDPVYNIYAIRITAQGEVAPGWMAGGTPTCTRPEGQGQHGIVPDGEGGAFITWSDFRHRDDVRSTDIYVQRITASGEIAPGWIPDGTPVIEAPAIQATPVAVTDGGGGMLIAWRDFRGSLGGGVDDGNEDLYATRVLGDGSTAPGWPADGVALCRAPDIQQDLVMVSDGLGGAILAWEDYRSYSLGTGTAADVYAQRVAGDGMIPSGWPADGKALCFVPDFQLTPTLAPDGAGGAFVAWEDPRSGINLDVYAQHVLASGEIAPGWDLNGLPVCTANGGQRNLVATSDGVGGAIVAWQDGRNGGAQLDIYAHKLGLDGPVPVLVSVVAADATAERVLLMWYAKGAAGIGATVERRTEWSPWEVLGAPDNDGLDQLRYEDRAVVPGERYGYRLRFWDEGTERWSGESWVEVPALTLSLAGFRPNPARGTGAIAFTLPSAERAELQVFDPRGRLVWSRAVGSMGPGSHALEIGAKVGLRPGVYWIRLRHGSRALTTRGVVVP